MKLGLKKEVSGDGSIAGWLRGVRPTSTIRLGALRLVTLTGPNQGADACFLEEAIQSGRTSIAEVGEHGTVGLVRVTHGGSLPLLIVDGEQVAGAKQDRIFNASFLVAPGQSVDLPVSCVERGRWSGSRHFNSTRITIPPGARAAKARRVEASLRRGEGYQTDQSMVWRDVDHYLARTDTHSPTAAFTDAYRSRRHHADSGVSSCTPLDGQVGIAGVSSAGLVSLDLFGSPTLYARGWEKVARGLFAEVYDGREVPGEPESLDVVHRALRTVTDAEPRVAAAPGLGDTVHMGGSGVISVGVAWNEVLFHALVIPSEPSV
jgi:hypothetical protein